MRFFEAKEYGLQTTGNPLFPRSEKSHKKLWLLLCILMLVALALGGLAAIIYGPYFSFQTIEVSGNVTLSADDISNTVKQELMHRNYGVLPNSHEWFFRPQKAEEVLKTSFPLKSAEIEKVGSTLKVTIVEDIFMVALRSGDEVYWLDPNGKVIRVATPEEKAAVLVKVGAVPAPADGQGGLAVIQTDLPVIREKIVAVHNPEDQLFDAEIIENIIQFSDGLRSIGITPSEFITDDAKLPWFSITSNKDYLVLFDATQNVDTQLTVLKSVMDEYLTPDATPRYIDVRFGTRVYVR